MANTFELIASSTVGAGGASTIDFSSIPNTFTDLALKISARNSAIDTGMAISFNGGGTTATFRGLQGDGSSTSSFGGTTFSFAGNINPSTSTASTFGSIDIYIPNAFGTNQKSMSIDSATENNGATAYLTFISNLYNLTSAISSIRLTPPNSFVQYSTAYLYGVKNA